MLLCCNIVQSVYINIMTILVTNNFLRSKCCVWCTIEYALLRPVNNKMFTMYPNCCNIYLCYKSK